MSARERRLWLAAAACQLAIYLSLPFARGISNWLRERGLLRLTVGGLFLIAVVWILWRVVQRRPGAREIVVLAVFGGIYAVVLLNMRIVEERVHFLEYGLIGGLIYAALRERRANLSSAGAEPSLPTRFAAITAVLLTSLLGWGDEGIQAALPGRFYELRDEGMNVAAGVLVVAAMATLRWSAARDSKVKAE